MTRPLRPLLVGDEVPRKVLLCLLLTWVSRNAGSDRYKARIVTIEVADLNSSLSFAIPRSGPAIRLAIEQSQAMYNDTMELLWEFQPGSCGPEIVGAVAADVYYTTGVDVFIGPGCSKAVLPLAHMANSWNLPVITPVGNTELVGDKTLFPRLTRTSLFMQAQFADVAVFLMKEYSWKNIAIINDEGTLLYDLLGLTFDQILQDKQELFWRRIPFTLSSNTKRDDFKDYLQDASRFARVFICLIDLMASRELFLAANELGYTSGDFVFILLGLTEMPTIDVWRRNQTDDQMAMQAFESVIFLVLAEPPKVEIEQFQRQMIVASREQYGYDYNDTEVASSIVTYYESVMLYTYVLNETLVAGADPRDGLAMTMKMWNRTFPGLAGPLVLNEVGDRMSNIAVVDLNPSSGNFETVLLYRVDNKSLQPQGAGGIFWPNGKGPPSNIPTCGFRNEKCAVKEETDLRITIALSTLFSSAILLGLVCFSVIYRRWKKVSQANLWWWRIEKSELSFISQPGSMVSIPSRTSRLSIGARQIRDQERKGREIAIFKGQHVHLRPLEMKKPVITSYVLQEFKLMQEISATNLVRVLGACLEEPPFALVTELCPKGTLQDLLGQNTLSLDTQFKLSLASDVVQGLAHLHASSIQHHGRLSSANCVIDNRFTVKLGDFGLPSLYRQELVDTTSQEHKRECLWRAPEILRGEAPSKGTREGDIYSFGIVLHEIVTRCFPFENEADYLTLDEILERVKRGGEHEFRPSAEVPASLSEFQELITSCWREDPRTRPTIVTVKKQLKNMATKFGQSANFLDNLLRRMEQYACNLEKMVGEKTEELAEEKKKADALLYEILPRGIADRLKRGLPVEPEQYECVTIYFSDIVGFTALSSSSTAMEVVDLLNDLYSTFDATVEGYDVYKVETIGDAYMVVSGLPHRNGNLHAQQIARMSLALRDVISVFKIRHRPNEKLQLRIGLHSGSVCAGVVGLKMPRYCLFGDTVNTASRMESYGEGMKIHMSSKTCEILQTFGTFDIVSRGQTEIKGKGLMTTYWLLGERKHCAAYP